MKCVSYTRTLPWKNHQGELAIAEQNQRIAAYLAEHKELDLLKKYSDRKNDEKARTAFDQMTDDGVERKFDCIIVASMYYCGPDFPAARQAIKETLYATGIDLIVLDEGLDTRTASRKEVEDYFEAKRRRKRAGHPAGKPPQGDHDAGGDADGADRRGKQGDLPGCRRRRLSG